MHFRSMLVLILCLSTLAVFGQIESPYHQNFVPKGAEPYAFSQYGNLSVNYFTGMPEVNLPLMELKSRDLVVPVSMSYDATGVKLEDISGPTGMKWNLIAGGFIQRELKGLPDELPSIGYIATAAATNNFNQISDFEDLINNHEQRNLDTEPDEFFIVLNHQTVKFVIDKYGKARTIPRQNLKIVPTISNGKISKVEVLFDNGVKYIFGENLNAIEERKIETLTTHVRFNEGYNYMCNNNGAPFVNPYLGEYRLDVTHQTKVIDFYNSRWFLNRIESSSGDFIDFTYSKINGAKFVTRPNILRIAPVHTKARFLLPTCDAFGNDVWTIQSVIVKYDAVNPGETPPTYPYPDPENPPGLQYYDPGLFPPYAGSTMVNQSLITENLVKPLYITAATNSTITFSTSQDRQDYPSAFRINQIVLKNMNLTWVKAIAFDYTTVLASTSNDLLGLSEAIMMSKISGLPPGSFYANNAKDYFETQVTDANLRKYTYEGLKEYNYRRMFLDRIRDVASNSKSIDLYNFAYSNPGNLRRRTTPMVDIYGFGRNAVSLEQLPIGIDRTANMTNAYNPRSGMDLAFAGLTWQNGYLTEIKYPTGGYTSLHVFNSSRFPKVDVVTDHDENANWVSKRQIEYLQADFGKEPIFETFFEHQFDGQSGWYKSRATSSFPQNRFNLTSGALMTHKETKVKFYLPATPNGASVYNGMEQYFFAGDQNPTDAFVNESESTSDVSTQIVSIPSEATSSLAEYFPFPDVADRSHLRGHLLEKRTLDANGRTLQSIKNYYEINPEGYVPSTYSFFQGGSYVYSNEMTTTWNFGKRIDPVVRLRFGKPALTFDWVALVKTEEVIYDQNDPQNKSLTKVHAFEYDVSTLLKLETSSYIKDDESRKVTTKNRYPTNNDYIFPQSCEDDFLNCQLNCPTGDGREECFYNCEVQRDACLGGTGSPETAAIIQLRRNNELSIPVETQTWTEQDGVSRLTSAVVYKYQKLGTSNIVKPKEVWSVVRPLLSSEYDHSYVNSSGDFVLDNAPAEQKMKKVHSFDSYDLTTGNLLRQTSVDGNVSAYHWNYEDLVDKYTLNPGGQQHESNFDHKPLVGIESSTDPNGITDRFYYDHFNRLKLIKDNSNYITNRYRYHYASEDEEFDAAFNIGGMMYTGNSLHFTTAYSDVGYGKNSFRWEFGDGQEYTGQVASQYHTYTAAGTYKVWLHITNPERNPISVSQEITIYPDVTVSVCPDGPMRYDICTNTAMFYGYCNPSVNNTSESPTVLKATISGGCPAANPNVPTYTFQWEYQVESELCYTTPWTSLGTSETVSAPAAFLNRTVDSCGPAMYHVRVKVTDQCGRTVTSLVVTLALIEYSC